MKLKVWRRLYSPPQRLRLPTADDQNPALPHNKEYTILYHQQ